MRVLATLALLLSFSAFSAGFEGTWVIDTRTAQEKKQEDLFSCGKSFFELKQNGQDIVGLHSYNLPDCSRLNEGGTVVGTAKGSTAILYVTSGRNGAIFKGRAALKSDSLHWVTLKELKAGDIEGDSPLILEKGVLHREKQQTPE